MTVIHASESTRRPTHPGEIMKDALHEHIGIGTKAAAEAIGITRQALHRVLSAEGALSTDMALRFCAFAGGSPEMLLRMQQAYDLWEAKKKLGRTLAKIHAERHRAVAA